MKLAIFYFALVVAMAATGVVLILAGTGLAQWLGFACLCLVFVPALLCGNRLKWLCMYRVKHGQERLKESLTLMVQSVNAAFKE